MNFHICWGGKKKTKSDRFTLIKISTTTLIRILLLQVKSNHDVIPTVWCHSAAAGIVCVACAAALCSRITSSNVSRKIVSVAHRKRSGGSDEGGLSFSISFLFLNYHINSYVFLILKRCVMMVVNSCLKKKKNEDLNQRCCRCSTSGRATALGYVFLSEIVCLATLWWSRENWFQISCHGLTPNSRPVSPGVKCAKCHAEQIWRTNRKKTIIYIKIRINQESLSHLKEEAWWHVTVVRGLVMTLQ